MKKYLLIASFISLAAWASEQTLQVEGMDCAGCIEKVETALRKSSDVEAVTVFVETGKVLVKTRNKKHLSRELAEKLLKDAGYKLKSM